MENAEFVHSQNVERFERLAHEASSETEKAKLLALLAEEMKLLRQARARSKVQRALENRKLGKIQPRQA